ncbi:hypothetical protein [Halosegnis sp.]|uniref:hypothetical protein n=1 Tax=Halosegnis sp. TaxID=2864959 RepID=UPI0035D44AEF
MLRVFVVAALLILAGCSAPTGAPASDTETATVTPVAVPETTATERQGVLAPGITDEGVADPGRLANAHASRLATVSYTVNQTLVQRYANGSLRSRYVTRARFAAEPGRFSATVHQVERENNQLVERSTRRFGDGERAYVADSEGNQTSYRLIRYPGGGPRDPEDVYIRNLTNAAAIERLFTLVDTETVGQFTENGTRYVKLRSGKPTTVPPLRNVTIEAIVSEHGVVRSYHIEYDVTRDGQLEAVVVVSYSEIGSTTVERPAWVDRVDANTTATSTPAGQLAEWATRRDAARGA